jgi:hypothetical protein
MRALLIAFAALGQTPIEDLNVFKPGEEGILYYYNPDADRPGTVWVTSDFFAWRELEKTIDAKDEQGYDEMEAQGRMYRVESGTKVRIIKFHLGDRYSEAIRKVPRNSPQIFDIEIVAS